MNEYDKGFLEALQAVCWMGGMKWKVHMKNAEDSSLSEAYQDAALTAAMTIGKFVSDLKSLGASIHRKQLDPKKIVTTNAPEHGGFWWANEEGKGVS